MKHLAASGDHNRITAVINMLITEFTCSPQANHRKVWELGMVLNFRQLSWRPSILDELVGEFWSQMDAVLAFDDYWLCGVCFDFLFFVCVAYLL